MAQIAYDVEVIVQEQNPICWVASCAMVKGFGTKASVGVGEYRRLRPVKQLYREFGRKLVAVC